MLLLHILVTGELWILLNISIWSAEDVNLFRMRTKLCAMLVCHKNYVYQQPQLRNVKSSTPLARTTRSGQHSLGRFMWSRKFVLEIMDLNPLCLTSLLVNHQGNADLLYIKGASYHDKLIDWFWLSRSEKRFSFTAKLNIMLLYDTPRQPLVTIFLTVLTPSSFASTWRKTPSWSSNPDWNL